MRAPSDSRAADEVACRRLVREGLFIDMGATLETAMPIFEKTNAAFIPVTRLVKGSTEPEIEGALFQVDALRAYNRALAARTAEEHS